MNLDHLQNENYTTLPKYCWNFIVSHMLSITNSGPLRFILLSLDAFKTFEQYYIQNHGSLNPPPTKLASYGWPHWKEQPVSSVVFS